MKKMCFLIDANRAIDTLRLYWYLRFKEQPQLIVQSIDGDNGFDLHGVIHWSTDKLFDHYLSHNLFCYDLEALDFAVDDLSLFREIMLQSEKSPSEQILRHVWSSERHPTMFIPERLQEMRDDLHAKVSQDSQALLLSNKVLGMAK